MFVATKSCIVCRRCGRWTTSTGCSCQSSDVIRATHRDPGYTRTTGDVTGADDTTTRACCGVTVGAASDVTGRTITELGAEACYWRSTTGLGSTTTSCSCLRIHWCPASATSATDRWGKHLQRPGNLSYLIHKKVSLYFGQQLSCFLVDFYKASGNGNSNEESQNLQLYPQLCLHATCWN